MKGKQALAEIEATCVLQGYVELQAEIDAIPVFCIWVVPRALHVPGKGDGHVLMRRCAPRMLWQSWFLEVLLWQGLDAEEEPILQGALRAKALSGDGVGNGLWQAA